MFIRSLAFNQEYTVCIKMKGGVHYYLQSKITTLLDNKVLSRSRLENLELKCTQRASVITNNALRDCVYVLELEIIALNHFTTDGNNFRKTSLAMRDA